MLLMRGRLLLREEQRERLTQGGHLTHGHALGHVSHAGRGGGHQHVREAQAAHLRDALADARHGAHLTRQADLAEDREFTR